MRESQSPAPNPDAPGPPSPAVRAALLHHAAGRLAQAAEGYRRAHEEDPADAQALLLLGIVARQAGHFRAAVELTARAAERRPRAAHVAFNLALALQGAGELDRAAETCQRSLALDPASERAWCCLGEIEAARGREPAARAAFERAGRLDSGAGRAALALGNLLCRRQRYEEALAAYASGIRAAPRNAELHFARGAASSALGRTTEARVAYRKALALKPNFPEAHLNLGNALYGEGNFPAAAACYRRALALRPRYMKAHCNLGNALFALRRFKDAVVCYERALAIGPAAQAARHNLGNALLRCREFRRAEESFRELLHAEPDRPEHHNSLGNALLQQRRAAESEECYRRAIALDPDYAAAHTNLGNLLLVEGRAEESERHYRRALALDPESPGGRYNLALRCLRTGNFREGWRLHESRWEFRDLTLRPRHFAQPQWRGEPLHGATVLLHAEQGLGDTLQFVRYVPLLAARGARVILEVQPELRRLLAGMPGVSEGIAHGAPLPEFAWHCPLMSLPAAFETELATIPAAVPYLAPETAEVAEAWRRYPRGGERLRVGLVWAGNPRHRGDQQRSTTLEALLPLAEAAGVRFFSLQRGAAAAQMGPLQSRFPLADVCSGACSRSKDLAGTAAVAATLDLVISVDTALAHLAGAMGLPVWVLLPHLADWRWLEARDDSPWYPTARLFRQPAPGDWRTVAENVRDELRRFPARRPASTNAALAASREAEPSHALHLQHV